MDGTTGFFIALGKQLKVLRERKGITQKEFGDLVGYGPDAVSSMERGVRIPRPEVLEKGDELLDAGGLLKAVIPQVKEAMARARTRHPEWYRGYAELEAQAVTLLDYSATGVLGLLQTEDHARAVFTQRFPRLAEETIEKRVADRLSRQELFDRWPPPECSFVMEQAVVERHIGGPSVHAKQLEHLLHIGRMRKQEQVAYMETQGYPRLVTDREEVRILNARYGIIRAQALNPYESLDLIEKTLEEL